ncbi:Glutathione-regulated potassium-efflux system protein KefB [Dyadobacter sp. CECT 9623]|uniref:Glutathione-regulated potassium-efflux system protein KefB n=1 Tax=Dyadobacter linearis TaxID=2823330 RepID=A0ABM8UW84_9BACT|nr:cation:proton antiporter [Dyadobacter sp. CECT 9623]CAG5073011.1 Glutathione-regulated potassium-efflux system protein KefB [Dyadobacter sp. CECT 9623]
MKNLRSILFYTVTLVIFSGLLYWFIIEGQKLESPEVAIRNPVPTTSSFEQFQGTFSHDLTSPLAILLLQIITIILVARVFGWFCKKIGQPTVIGETAAGLFLGPSLVGTFFPEFSAFLFPKASLSNLQFLSQIGLILFMFIIGMELDLKVLKTKAKEAIVISHASIVLPFALGVGLALMLYQEFAPAGISFLSFSLFTGIALSVTAFPVLARIVQERGLSKTRLGMMVITCAATDDITAWCILAAVIAIVKAGSFVSSLYTILLAIAYVLVMLNVVKPFLKRLGDHYDYKEGLTKPVVAIFFVVLLASAYSTEVIGIHALFGAFMAGVIMPSNHKFRNIFIEKVEDVSMVLLLPLFFVFTGLRTQVGLLNDPYLWKVTGIIMLAAVAGKFIGSAVAARFVKQSWRDSLIIGSLMNTRGLMELVVLNIGYDIGVLSPQIFTMMVIMALLTTCMTGPALDLIDRFMPEKTTLAEVVGAVGNKFAVVIAFASPLSGRKMLKLASQLSSRQETKSLTALHLSPSSYLSQVDSQEYETETFRPITEEAEKLEVPVTTLFKPSQDIEHDIIEYANTGGYDLLMMGIGHGAFEGTFLGKLLGITNKIISPVRLFDTITGKEKLFHADIFDERTSHVIKSVKVPVALLIDKNLSKTERIFLPIFSSADRFLLDFAARMIGQHGTTVTIMDPTGLLDQKTEVREAVAHMQSNFPDRIELHNENALEKEFLVKQDLMLISYQSWKLAVRSHSVWLSHSPSVLVIRT